MNRSIIKKIVGATTVVVVLGVGVMGCGDDSNPSNGGGDPPGGNPPDISSACLYSTSYTRSNPRVESGKTNLGNDYIQYSWCEGDYSCWYYVMNDIPASCLGCTTSAYVNKYRCVKYDGFTPGDGYYRDL